MGLLHSGYRSAPHSGRLLPERSDLLHVARNAIATLMRKDSAHTRLSGMTEGHPTACRLILPPVSAQRSTRYSRR